MEEFNNDVLKNKRKIILICGLLTIILSLSGIAFAYFQTTISTTSESISVATTNLGTLSGEGESISLISPEPSDSASNTTYTVTSSNDTTVSKTYTLSLEIDSNTFVNTVEDLQGNATTQNNQLIISVTVPNNVEEFTFYEDNDFVTYNSTTRVITIDVTNSFLAAAGTYQLLTGVSIEPGETQEYGVTFQFKNLESYNQSDNMGRRFRGGLIIENDQQPDIIPGYKEIAYLQSSGTQYIDTGVTVSSLVNPSLYTKYMKLNTGDTDVFGTASINENTILWDTTNSQSSSFYPRWGTTSGNANGFNYEGSYNSYIWGFTDSAHSLKLEGTATNMIAYIDNIKVATYQNQNGSFTSNETILLFKGRNYSNVTWYWFNIENNNIDVIKLTPCIRKSDSKPGMCDTVNSTFYSNQGTGEFGYETLDGTVVSPT